MKPTTCKASSAEWFDIAQSFFRGMRAAMNVNYAKAIIAVAAVTPKRYTHAFKILQRMSGVGMKSTAQHQLFELTRIDWETPQALFDELDAEFHFQLDVCASPKNAKCEPFFTIQDDGLSRPWAPYGSCWMNPPYGREIGRWVRKASEEAEYGCTVVGLVPARTDTAWWHDYVIAKATEVRFLRGRVSFSGGGPAPFPSAVVVWEPRNEKAPDPLNPDLSERGRRGPGAALDLHYADDATEAGENLSLRLCGLTGGELQRTLLGPLKDGLPSGVHLGLALNLEAGFHDLPPSLSDPWIMGLSDTESKSLSQDSGPNCCSDRVG